MTDYLLLEKRRLETLKLADGRVETGLVARLPCKRRRIHPCRQSQASESDRNGQKKAKRGGEKRTLGWTSRTVVAAR
ncbi:MAG: hypothetical protein Q9P01_16680 [Anaerolineae bacterium]|nr:hypothetical protein [Anaerolineae bacterium]